MSEAVFNFLAFLGWNPGGNEEIFSRDELIKLFDEKRLSKAPAAFDQKKMDWIDNEYIKHAPLERVVEMAKPFLEAAGRLDERAEKFVEMYQPQMKSAEEIVPLTDLFFGEMPEWDEAEKEMMSLETSPVVVAAFKEKLAAIPEADFTSENIYPLFKQVQKETGVKGKNLWMPIRIASTGSMHGPELHNAIALLGKEVSLNHLETALKK